MSRHATDRTHLTHRLRALLAFCCVTAAAALVMGIRIGDAVGASEPPRPAVEQVASAGR
ncbi:hypothetical protein [Marmoricola sp. RAF53]|uniref:hypothetical protein n=1 Tax=Marmoricola sp. RAF53 TaxID=3233059 RepID=UPI003F969736